MQDADLATYALVPGQQVRARVLEHFPWGVMVRIVGHERAGASVDFMAMDRPSGAPRSLPPEFPPVGAEVTAVVQEVRRWEGRSWVRLSLRAADLAALHWRCDLCMTTTTLSPGGDGLTLEVRSAGGPESHTVVAHRACLLDALHPDSLERARAERVGLH
ncbi:hypothetical protein F4561_001892 [Lipingzhangella halophila]|uniref:Uncharacterized protein n=1 Tax=Lipingzhangella halophila TaxID=1783352 RepID=A0A7W7RFQ0_9ACTN|nr:hypothetical protein [Lipingzhangella halophila]MBB4931072.1 hypothetical protein [Lipingzhangella halophila]